ncbi:hypothetical protein [Haladaptatus sp. W1]|uniref:hypothetical protein n=1 Tax=Haladaptatus sp. W1 TaxID=1897478 RepID=UPI0020C7E83F|nr:hypothetical protein [Haladaptatus sp. W1]
MAVTARLVASSAPDSSRTRRGGSSPLDERPRKRSGSRRRSKDSGPVSWIPRPPRPSTTFHRCRVSRPGGSTFAAACLERGIDYVDVSPTDTYLREIEALDAGSARGHVSS